MIINDVAYAESLAFLEWLEERYPKPSLLPLDPNSRLRVRQLCQIIVAGTQPLQNLGVQRYYSSDPKAQQVAARHWIERGLSAYEAIVKDTAGSYSFGAHLTLADLCLIPQCYNAKRNDLSLEQFPIINRIYIRSLSREDCKKAAPESQPQATKGLPQ